MSQPRAGVLVVGSVNADLVVRVERLPRAGETVTGGEFAHHGGGKGANQAVAAARFGAYVVFAGAVGDDDLGHDSLAEMSREGIDVSRCLVVPGQPTGVALIAVDATGENQIAVASGANGALDGVAVEETLAGLDSADHARLRDGVVLANLEVSDDAVIAGAGFGRRLGMRLVLNPAPARPLPPALLAMEPLIVANEGEAQALSGRTGVQEAAEAITALTGAPVVVTLGREGALVLEEGRVSRVAAPQVESVDSTGAGDTFCGVLAAALAEGIELEPAAQMAVRAAAMTVTIPGAREGMPRRGELEAWGA